MVEPSGEQKRSLYGLEGDAELGLPPPSSSGTLTLLRFILGTAALTAFLQAPRAIDVGNAWLHPIGLLSLAAGLVTLALGVYAGWVLWKVRTAPMTLIYKLWFACMFGGSLCELLGKLAARQSVWWMEWLLPVLALVPLTLVFLRPSHLTFRR